MKTPLVKLVSFAFLVVILMLPSALRSEAKTKKAKASPAAKGSPAEGQTIFQSQCGICHFTDEIKPKIGPGLKGLFKTKALPSSHKPVTEANVREAIEKGSPDAKPMPMPAFGEKLTPQEIQDLIAYLRTL